MTFRVDLHDGGALADYIGREPKGISGDNEELDEMLSRLWDINGPGRAVWRAYRTKRGGTTLAFKDRKDAKLFTQWMNEDF